MRKLRFENLERRDLLSGSYDWPADLGVVADIFVDGGAYLSSLSIRSTTERLGWASETLLTSSTTKTRETIGGNSSDLNGALLYPDGQPAFPLIYVNGGKASSHGSALGSSGRQAMRDFVYAGGSYSGSCAGAFLIGDYSSTVLHLWEGRMGVNGTGTQTVSFADWPDHPVSQYLVANGIESMKLYSVPHYGGPRIRESYRHPEGTEFVGRITSGIAAGSSYLLEYRPTPESGLIAVQPSHPEYGRRESHLALNAAILSYAASGSQVAPKVKGKLVSGEPIAMVGATEKVGEKQYHLFQFDVPERSQRLTVTLSGLSGNADLYLQHEGFANERSFRVASEQLGMTTEEIEIDLPDSGVWYVGIRGTHSIANGAEYTITATISEIGFPPWFRQSYDVDRNGQVEPADVLRVVNALNAEGSPLPACDANQDGRVTPLDVLVIINCINVESAGFVEIDVII